MNNLTAFLELFWTLMTLTPFLAVIYLLDRAAARRLHAARKYFPHDTLPPLPPIIKAEGWRG